MENKTDMGHNTRGRRVVLYCRVATDADAGKSLEAQKEKLHKFLAAVAPDVHRIKGFCDLKETGWTQVDVVGSLIDYKECGAFERSQLVFISKIGPMVIKKIFSAWEEHVGSEMKLKN